LPEGDELPWDKLMQGRLHEIVKPANRILNADSLWSKYVGMAPLHTDATPFDTYDGAASGTQRSWSVVDDTCDGVLECHLVVRAKRFSAHARVIACVPDYAPDRRPFVSIAEDFADRDLQSTAVNAGNLEITKQEIADLFDRIFETATLINLDAERYKFISQQSSPPDEEPPHLDFRSMTKEDAPYAERSAMGLIDKGQAAARGAGVSTSKLQYTDLARSVHAGLTDTDTLLDFLRTEASRVRRMVRPPYGRFKELSPSPTPSDKVRDPRIWRDRQHDMRMPPYMRDSDATPLSLSRRQYHSLMSLLTWLEQSPDETPGGSKRRLARAIVELQAKLDMAAKRDGR